MHVRILKNRSKASKHIVRFVDLRDEEHVDNSMK